MDKTNKKAELTTMQIGIIILLIVSFVIILFVYWQFNWTGTISKEACHNSVILKASTPTVQERKVLDFPLRCKTNKICFVLEKNQVCGGFSGTDKKEIETIQVKNIKDLNIGIANALYDCWWMMGEGKIDIFSRSLQAKSYSASCVECSRIDFSPELKEKIDDITDFYKFLNEEKISNTNTKYSDYLYANLGTSIENPVEFAKLDRLPTTKSYSIMFVQYARTTAPEDIGTALGGLVGAFAPDLVNLAGELPVVGVAFKIASYGLRLVETIVGKEQLRTVLGIVGASGGNSIGAALGGLIGEKYVSVWMVLPSQAESEGNKKELSLSYLTDLEKFGVVNKSIKKTEDICSAKEKRTGNLYALKKDSSALYNYDETEGWVKQLIGEQEENEMITYTKPNVFEMQNEFSIRNGLIIFKKLEGTNWYNINKQDESLISYQGEISPEGKLGKLWQFTRKFDELGKLTETVRTEGLWQSVCTEDEIKNANLINKIVQSSKAAILRQITSELYAHCYGLSQIQCNWESIV